MQNVECKIKGFTLVELLVAVAVFSIIGGIASEVLVSGLRAQRKSLAYQELLDESSYLMEYMSRSLRMAKKDLSGTCLTTAGPKYNYETNGSRDRIRFLNYQNICQEFFLDGNQLKERESTDDTADNPQFVQTSSPLTSGNLQVNLFQIDPFYGGWSQDDNLQPKVTFSLEIQGKEQAKIKIQTTVSQRNPDIQKGEVPQVCYLNGIPQTCDGAAATALGCTAGDEGCRRCSAGSCTYYTSDQHYCSASFVCSASGTCTLTSCYAKGTACTSESQCCSGFCADGVCCDTACTGSTCQRCDSYSYAGVGNCGYVSSSAQDPRNECGTTGCYTGNCSGTGYACGYYTSDQHNCSTCTACNASGNCANADTDYGDNLYGCTGTHSKCSSGSCVSYTCGGHFDNENGTCTATVQPGAKDTYLNGNAKTTNYGTATYLYILNRSSRAMRPIVEFNITGIPAGATLNSASLQLYYYNYANTNPSGKTVWAYKQTHTDWVENQATWNIYRTGSNWTTAGGDYVTSNPSGGSTTFPASKLAWMSWDVLAIVQDAYANSIPAEFLIKFETEGLSANYSRGYFYSNNYTTDITLRPQLIITYTPTPQ